MPTPFLARLRPHRWALLAACASACVGTPTPEPPDGFPVPELLPTPGGDMIFARESIDVVSFSDPPSAPLVGGPGSVTPNSRVWIVNLDNAASVPLEIRARADGSFGTMVRGTPGERLRIVSRLDSQHSLPLDAQFMQTENRMLRVVALPAPELSCLQITPVAEITRVVADGQSTNERFELVNRCDQPVSIDEARLRFGDQGFRLTAPPESIPVDGRASLEVSFDGHDDAREHADIVLLDVTSGTDTGRYALGVWSVSTTGSGND